VEEVRELQAAVAQVYVDELVEAWLIGLVRSTRQLDEVAIGASVRGSLALERAVRAWALLAGRNFVTPDDVEELFLPVLGHRVIFAPTFLVEMRRTGRAQALERFRELCLSRVPRPDPEGGEVVSLPARRL
jgi:MoxR-like ATPase